MKRFSDEDMYERPDRAEIAERVRAELGSQLVDQAPVPAPVRCRECGYVVTSIGHRVICDTA